MVMQMIKKLFNIVFKEETKNIIRNRFKGTFLFLDKVIIYKEYLKACRYILKKEIFKYPEKDYGYRYGSFLAQIRLKYLRTAITNEKIKIRDREMQKCIDYVKENGPDVYCGSLNGISVYSEQDFDMIRG